MRAASVPPSVPAPACRVELCGIDAASESNWDRYVAAQPDSGHCHRIGWRRAIARSYRHDAHYLWAWREERLCGVLPLVFLRSRLFSRGLVSMPFLDDGGILADDAAVAQALLDAAVELLARLRAGLLDLRHRYPQDLPLQPHSEKVTFRLALPQDSAKLWAQLDGKVRNQVRKAERSQLEFSWGGKGELSDFYAVFAENMRDLGSPVHGLPFFQALFEEFADSAKLALVSLTGRVVGGAVCLAHGSSLQVPWASSLRELRSLCPNNLLYWGMLKWGAESGFRCFDFGRSSRDSGTYHFKKQWGAREEALHWQVGGTAGARPGVSSDAGASRLLVRVWQRLPVGLSRRIGPAIRRHISN